MQKIMKVWADATGEPTQTPNGKLFKNIFLEETSSAYMKRQDDAQQDESKVWYDGFMGTLFGEYAMMKFEKGDLVAVDLQFSCRSDVKDGATRYFNGIEVRSISKL